MRKEALIKKIQQSAVSGVDRYFTKLGLAEKIVKWALEERSETLRVLEPETLRFLEPSAGGGAFVDAVLAYATKNSIRIEVTAVEMDTVLAARLLRKYANDPRVKVICADFMTFKVRPGTESEKPFDIAFMNPPYGSRKLGTVGEDARHVRQALRFAKRVVGLLVTGFEHGKTRQMVLFNEALVKRRAVLVRRPGFSGPEDKGESARRDHVVLEFAEHEHQGHEWLEFSVPTQRWYLNQEGETT